MQVCPACGHSFDSGSSDDTNKTIMGFPAIESPDSSEVEEVGESDNKSTLFGFPAIESEDDAREPTDESLEEDSYSEYDGSDDTHLIPAEELQKEFEADQRRELRVEREPDPMQGTVAGIPAVSPDDNDEADSASAAWGLDEPSDSATSVVPGSMLTSEDAPADDAGYSRTHPEGNESFPNHGTLMGMSLTDFEKDLLNPEQDSDPSRATQFAIPAVQQDELAEAGEQDPPADVDADDADTSDDELDAPTAMWNPSQELEDESDPRRREVLEKLRQQRDSKEEETPARTTAENARPLGDLNVSAKAEPGVAPTASESSEGGSTGDPLSALPAPSKKSNSSESKERPRLPDAAELRARLKAKREALRTNRAQLDPGSIPAPNPERNLPADSALNQANPDTLTDNASTGRERPLAESGVLGGSSYFKAKGDIHPEQPVKKTGEKRVSKLQLDSTMQAQANDNPESVSDSSIHESDEFSEDFAFAETTVAPADIYEEPADSVEFDASDSDLFATDPQIELDPLQEPKPGSETQPDSEFSPNSDPSLGSDALINRDRDADTSAQIETAPPQIEQAPTPGDPPRQAGSEAPPVVNQQLADRLPDEAPDNPVQPAPKPASVTQEVSEPRDVMLAQRIFGVLGGLGLLFAGVWGVLTTGGLIPSAIFALSALFGMVSLALVLLPLPDTLQKIGLGLVGLSQPLAGLVLLVLVSTVSLPAVIVVCAGVSVLMALAFPIIISKLS